MFSCAQKCCLFRFTHKKTQKAQNVKQALFFLLDVFMRIKMLSFLFHTQKSTKSIKITKTQISEQATFLTLDVFMRIKMLSFLFLFACMRFVFFVRVKSSCKKKNK